MLKILWPLLWLSNYYAEPYKAVVLDAVTKQPVPFAVVERLNENGVVGGLTTDEAGFFSVADGPVHLRISSINYTALEITRSSQPAGQLDTIRLYPRVNALQEVLVRPGRSVSLATFSPKEKVIGSGMLPGQAVAQLLKPSEAARANSMQLHTIRLSLRDKPKSGRLRIRVLNVLEGEATEPHPRPGILDLLPQPLVFTAEELADLPRKTLSIDLTPYGLTLPPDGVYVMIECLLDDPALIVETVSVLPADPKHLTIKGRDAQHESVTLKSDFDEYPTLQANFRVPTKDIWYRFKPLKGWEQHVSRSYSLRIELEALLN